jgi:hypothetical protein
MRQRQRERYHRDPDKHRAASRAYREKDPERFSAMRAANYQKLRNSTPWLSLIYTAKDRAKAKRLDFDLTPEWAMSIWTGRCAVTDLPFSIGLRGTGPKRMSPSIDRIDSACGYTQNNCRFILHAVNALKQDGTDEDMLFVAESIVRMLKKD